ncbi:MAG: PA14 domain-containing protein [Chitinophagaceae bacterium]|nr:PA14 domain-containing protein [Chitinophagaceae bacterium]
MTTGQKLLKRTGEAAKLDSWYGQEYDYTTLEEINGEMKVISSGVATYEPGVGNEENPFREILQFRTTQPLGPTSNDNVELPFGEMFFPATMVGYSRVTVRSIHNKTNKRLKAGVGLQQTNFYTSKDFPVIMDYTSFDKESRSHHKPGLINKVFEFRMKDYVTLTQGFRVIINDMNGKIKSQASYPENDYKNPINFTSYHYRMVPKGNGKFRLDNYLPVIKGPDGIISNQLIGKDVEVINDFRQHTTTAQSAQIPLNADAFKVGSIPFLLPTFFRLVFTNENRYRAATTLKVVNEYGILDSVLNIDKGSVVGTRNLIYDAETGDVLLTRTTNEFKDPVYQFSYPAWWAHSGMEPAYRNLDMIYSGVIFRNGIIDNPTEEMMMNFESGDEIFVMFSDNEGPLEGEACMQAGFLDRLTPGSQPLIWALDIRKDLRNEDKKFIFLDRYGVPYNAQNATIRVIRSGKRNLSGASAGSFVSTADPVREMVGGGHRIVIDNLTEVVNAGAVEFRERWRANDQFYTVDNTVVTVRQTPIISTQITAEETFSLSRKLHYSDRTLISHAIIEPGQFAISKLRRKLSGSRRNFDQQSWMLLNLPPELAGATVKKAVLVLPPHYQNHPPIPASEHYKDVFALGEHKKPYPHQTYKLTDHSASTEMKVSRMVTPWESTDDEYYWLTVFDDTWANDQVNNLVRYMPFYTPSNAQFSQHYEINIPQLMQGIVNNYGNPDQPPALKFSFSRNSFAIDNENSNTPWRFCFKTHNTPGEPSGEHNPPNVHINLDYYKCQETDPVVYSGDAAGAPTVAPAGYVYCREESIQKICLSTFDKKQMNPYIQGILGNWRAYRSYVFYGDRKESDPSQPTNIRKDGQLKDFVNFWVFAENEEGKLSQSADVRWVWNSEITQYNRKGAELENRDPLDRYNSGIYGYQESMPVAVVNNSRLRLSAFDGFEDYAYQDDPCQPFCEPTRRHFKTGITSSMLSLTEAHTGRHSLKIDQNTNFDIDIPVSANNTESNPDQLIEIIKTEVEDVLSVNPRGIGLKGDYYDYSDFTNFKVSRTDDKIKLRVRQGVLTGDVLYLPDGISEQYNLSVRWTGSLQVTRKGDYDFDAVVDDDIVVSIKIAGVWETVLIKGINNHTPTRQKVHLLPGNLYEIKTEYVQKSSDGYVQLLWRQPDVNELIPENAPYLDIPKENMYPAGQETLADNSVESVTGYCEKPDDIQAIGNQFIDGFELVPGQKMVVSVWVKKGEEDCHCSSYDDVSIVVKDASGTPIESVLKPKENIIEGWQQMEAVFTVPESGEKITLSFTAPSDKVLFADDLRFHPYNANMKSFVYDPVSLRLVADLDENNFASFYEYDDEGTLIRVKKGNPGRN